MCVKGDGDGSTSVSDYVEQLRADLIQQAVHERSRWLYVVLNTLNVKSTKNGKPSLRDIAGFLQLPIANDDGWLVGPNLKSNIVDRLIGNLPDSSAAASAPAMGFVVALSFF